MKIKLIYLSIMLIPLLLSGCHGPTIKQPSQEQMNPKTRSYLFSGQIVNRTRVVRIEAVKYAFIPDTIVVKKGEHVKLLVKSTEGKHGIRIDEYRLEEILPPGEEKTLEFVANDTGSFPFHCSIYCGRGHEEMRGMITVVDGH